MLSRSGRPFFQWLFGPVAKVLARWGVSPNTLTVAGTLLTAGIALWLIPTDHLTAAAWTIFACVVLDNLDGQVARLTGKSSKFGALLDSTMDRLADGAIFLAVGIWAYLHADPDLQAWTLLGTALALLMGAAVPYVRARAEGLGYEANIGVAERADRLTVILVAVWFAGMEWGDWWVTAAVWILTVAGFGTTIQRLAYVAKQAKGHPLEARGSSAS